jgi:3',5'-cyclic AMP phosphodiesterase CpdA
MPFRRYWSLLALPLLLTGGQVVQPDSRTFGRGPDPAGSPASGVTAGPAVVPAPAQQDQMFLPMKPNSVRFAVIGDAGTGERAQYQVAHQIWRYYQAFPFTFAILLGDNVYGSERPQDMARKFEQPYQSLLKADVEFYAALGNHDDPNQRYYKLFNLDGNRYRSFEKGNVTFLVLDSNYLDPEQVKWVEEELKGAGSNWKIPYFHHPLYTTARRGPELELREILEPLFVEYGAEVVFTGHEHIYERMKPQKGIYHFIAGGSAKLREGDTRATDIREVGYAEDRTFMLVEIAGDSLYFQTITRTGRTVDRGIIGRKAREEAPVAH